MAEAVLADGRVLLLVDASDPDTIAGWVAYDSHGPIWVYVLAPKRKRTMAQLRQEALRRGLWSPQNSLKVKLRDKIRRPGSMDATTDYANSATGDTLTVCEFEGQVHRLVLCPAWFATSADPLHSAYLQSYFLRRSTCSWERGTVVDPLLSPVFP